MLAAIHPAVNAVHNPSEQNIKAPPRVPLYFAELFLIKIILSNKICFIRNNIYIIGNKIDKQAILYYNEVIPMRKELIL